MIICQTQIFFNIKKNLEGFTVDNKTATIALNASESGVIDLEGYQLATFHMPAAWTTADITFLVAPTADGTYQPLYFAGEEVTETVAAGQCVAPENYIPLASVRFLKIRSGTSLTPVAQAATREKLKSPLRGEGMKLIFLKGKRKVTTQHRLTN